MLNTWDQDRKHMKYRSEMSWRKVPFPLHGSPLLILLFSPLFFVSMESPHKIRQGYAFCSIFCAYMKLAFFFSLCFLSIPLWVLHFIFLLVCEEQTPPHGLKAFSFTSPLDCCDTFFSYAAIYPACKYKHVYSMLSRILKPPTRLTAKSRRLHWGFAINCW